MIDLHLENSLITVFVSKEGLVFIITNNLEI